MAALSLAELNWKQVAALPPAETIALLPVGATEAHGPHLPLSTDVIISQAMAEAGAARLTDHGVQSVLLPPIAYSVTEFAAAFSGTISLSRSAATAVLSDIVRALDRHGFRALGIANAHLEPAHISSINDALAATDGQRKMPVVFPDITRRSLAQRLTEEFRSGACHAGQYEGSIVLATKPHLVDETTRRSLASNPASLVTAIREGQTGFEEAGGPEAYFGDPAAATAAEGERTLAILGDMLAEAVLEAI